MADYKVCDKCGDVFKPYYNNIFKMRKQGIFNVKFYADWDWDYEFDLCHICAKKVLEFINPDYDDDE